MTSLINKLHDDMIAARKASDPVAKSLLVTLYSEASKVGKDKRNGDTTDQEAIAVVKKFITNAMETKKLLLERGQSCLVQEHEITILSGYLPLQLSDVELAEAINKIISDNGFNDIKSLGTVMTTLKGLHDGQYDGKTASMIAKNLLNNVTG